VSVTIERPGNHVTAEVHPDAVLVGTCRKCGCRFRMDDLLCVRPGADDRQFVVVVGDPFGGADSIATECPECGKAVEVFPVEEGPQCDS
jgi:hypothetical protein